MNENEYARFLVQSARDYAQILMDGERRILFWSTGAERIFGWTQDEMLGQSADQFFTPEDRDAGRPYTEVCTAQQNGSSDDTRWHLRKNGSRFWANGKMRPVYDDAGDFIGFGKVVRDDTERHETDEKLREAFARERRITLALQRPLREALVHNAFTGLTVAARYEPAFSDEADVGGDYYDVFSVPGPPEARDRERVALVVGDASGKGLTAAARALQVRELVRALARRTPDDPAAALSRVNNMLHDTRHFDSADEDEGFVCVVLVILDCRTGMMYITNAGCELPLCVPVVPTGTEPNGAFFDVGGPPLGAIVGAQYRTVQHRLSQDEVLLLVSDGITEARQIEGDRDFLGPDGFTRLATAALALPVPPDTSPLQHVADGVLEGARIFGGGVLRDDACVLVARRGY